MRIYEKATRENLESLEKMHPIICCKEHPEELRATKGRFLSVAGDNAPDADSVRFVNEKGEERISFIPYIWILREPKPLRWRYIPERIPRTFALCEGNEGIAYVSRTESGAWHWQINRMMKIGHNDTHTFQYMPSGIEPTKELAMDAVEKQIEELSSR